MTPAQLRHIRAAQDGALFVNDRGGPIRRAVWVGGHADQRVCERLRKSGALVQVPIPGCAVQFQYQPSPAALAALRAHDERTAMDCERCGGPHDHQTETCCSSHQKRLCHACYRRTHFVEVCSCELCRERPA